jgi:hypothetical protein
MKNFSYNLKCYFVLDSCTWPNFNWIIVPVRDFVIIACNTECLFNQQDNTDHITGGSRRRVCVSEYSPLFNKIFCQNMLLTVNFPLKPEIIVEPSLKTKLNSRNPPPFLKNLWTLTSCRTTALRCKVKIWMDTVVPPIHKTWDSVDQNVSLTSTECIISPHEAWHLLIQQIFNNKLLCCFIYL